MSKYTIHLTNGQKISASHYDYYNGGKLVWYTMEDGSRACCGSKFIKDIIGS